MKYQVIINKLYKKFILFDYQEQIVVLFGIFGVVNFILFDLLWNYINSIEIHNQYIRSFAALLCSCLAVYRYWPEFLRKFLKPLWVITVIYCLPFFGTYMFLLNYTSPAWQSNIILGLFWLILITDWVTFSLFLFIGVISGVVFYHFTHGAIPEDIILYKDSFINLAWSIVIAILFSRKRELVEKTLKLNQTKSLNRKIRIKNIKLKKALNIKNEFLNNLSHEVRTPTQGIYSLSDGLVEHWKRFNEVEKFELAKKIALNAKRLTSLIITILDLSKINTGKLAMHFEHIDLIELIKDIKSESEDLYLINNNNIEIHFMNPGFKVAMVLADRERIMQVLRNLLINAIKFTKEGIISIELGYNIEKSEYIFSLSDNGIGIPEEEMTDIFKPFFQSSKTKTGAGGTGLGLSISKEIIEAHKGIIWAENLQPNGAKLSFTIPVIKDYG